MVPPSQFSTSSSKFRELIKDNFGRYISLKICELRKFPHGFAVAFVRCVCVRDSTMLTEQSSAKSTSLPPPTPPPTTPPDLAQQSHILLYWSGHKCRFSSRDDFLYMHVTCHPNCISQHRFP